MMASIAHRLPVAPPVYPGCPSYRLGRFHIFQCVEDFWFVDEVTSAGRVSLNRNFSYSEFPSIDDVLDFLKTLLKHRGAG